MRSGCQLTIQSRAEVGTLLCSKVGLTGTCSTVGAAWLLLLTLTQPWLSP